MTTLVEKPRSTYYQAFVRDGHACVYCGKDILASLDSFAASHLDHLKPKHAGGTDELINSVTACSVCNSMKAGYDPSPEGPVTPETFDLVLARARNYIESKRAGTTPCSYVVDYNYWLKESGRAA
jgi:5-methylcytosine-specific restriction endonuclease McrA